MSCGSAVIALSDGSSRHSYSAIGSDQSRLLTTAIRKTATKNAAMIANIFIPGLAHENVGVGCSRCHRPFAKSRAACSSLPAGEYALGSNPDPESGHIAPGGSSSSGASTPRSSHESDDTAQNTGASSSVAYATTNTESAIARRCRGVWQAQELAPNIGRSFHETHDGSPYIQRFGRAVDEPSRDDQGAERRVREGPREAGSDWRTPSGAV